MCGWIGSFTVNAPPHFDSVGLSRGEQYNLTRLAHSLIFFGKLLHMLTAKYRCAR